MKITKQRLKDMIAEELNNIMSEGDEEDPIPSGPMYKDFKRKAREFCKKLSPEKRKKVWFCEMDEKEPPGESTTASTPSHERSGIDPYDPGSQWYDPKSKM